MADYQGTATTTWPIEAAFDYVADFSNVSEWDPTLDASRLTSGEPRTVGSIYEVDAEIAGKTVTFVYEVVESDRPERIKLVADHDLMRSEDTITFSERGGEVEVTYDAQIEFKGAAKVFDPPFALAFQRVGSKAESGLQEALRGGPATG